MRKAAFLFAAVLVLTAGVAQAQTAAAGYSIEEIASGLNGPEGLTVRGNGHIIVAEAQADVPPSQPQDLEPCLTIVKKNGTFDRIACTVGETWAFAAWHPANGYAVTQIGVPFPPTPGVQRIRDNGGLGAFIPTGGLAIGLTADRVSGDLYVSVSGFGMTGIHKVTPTDAYVAVRSGLRVDGMAVTEGRLIAAVSLFDVTYPGAVLSIDPATGAEELVALTGLAGAAPFGIAVDKRGSIWVSDRLDGRLRRIDPDGAGGWSLPEVVAEGFSTTSIARGNESFNGVAVGADGTIYVSDYGAGKIYAVRTSSGRGKND